MRGIGEIRQANKIATAASPHMTEAVALKACKAAARYLIKSGYGHDGAIAFFIEALQHVEAQQREEEQD